MATWNTDKPAVGNSILADIADIEENLQELHDVIEAITSGTLGTTEPASFEVDTLADGTTGFASTTTQPFYQNSAPTGWTRNSALTDNSMFSYAASGNVATGGSASAIASHTHTVPNHKHAMGLGTAGTYFNVGVDIISKGGNLYAPYSGGSGSVQKVKDDTATDGTCETDGYAPYYIEMILAAVD